MCDSYIVLALYVLGFVLSYTAVFTVPKKEHAMKVAEPFHLHGQMSDSFRAAFIILRDFRTHIYLTFAAAGFLPMRRRVTLFF